MRKQGVIKEKTLSQTPVARRQRKHRESVTSAHHAQVSQPDPLLQVLDQQIKEQRAKEEPEIPVTPCSVADEPQAEPAQPKRVKVEVSKISFEELEEVRKESASNAITTGREYGQQILAVREALLDLKAKVKSISLYRGTRFLEEVREVDSLAAQDLQLLRECANLIIEIGGMAHSSNGPEVIPTAE